MSDETKVIELRPEQKVLREAELEHRRCQHSYLFQQIAVAMVTGLGNSLNDLEINRVLQAAEVMAECVLDITEVIRKK